MPDPGARRGTPGAPEREETLISREVEIEILRLHTVEKWPSGTIASQFGLHHDVVDRVIRQAGLPTPRPARKSQLDPYMAFIRDTWQRYPGLTASRLWAMCRERGYGGNKDHFRHRVAPLRPRPRGEAYLRLRTLPGEQAQVDWGHFGKVAVGRAKRPLLAFVAVLSYSRAIFLRFFLGQQGENFLRGHVAAFSEWAGVARVVLYDNLKSAVLERVGDAIRFHPAILELARHYRFEPRPVPPGRANEKGRVERAIRYVRSSFFAARPWRDLDDLNAQAIAWCRTDAMDRPWPEEPGRTVADAFAEERPSLLALPEVPFFVEERREARTGKTPYVRFDGNDYSVPHDQVRKVLGIVATLTEVRIFSGPDEIATHARSYDRGHAVEDARHIETLVAQKRDAHAHRGIDRLAHAAPSTQRLLAHLAEQGVPLGRAIRELTEALETYGASALEAAVAEVLAGKSPHPSSVRLVLERERRSQKLPPSLPIPLPDDPRIRDLRVKPHPLSNYDPSRKEPRDAPPEDRNDPC